MRARMRTILILLFAAHSGWAETGGRAEYVGGTLTAFDNRAAGRVLTTSDETLSFKGKGQSFDVSYDKINLIEYGQKVDRRYLAAVLISPLFLMSKKRNHFSRNRRRPKARPHSASGDAQVAASAGDCAAGGEFDLRADWRLHRQRMEKVLLIS